MDKRVLDAFSELQNETKFNDGISIKFNWTLWGDGQEYEIDMKMYDIIIKLKRYKDSNSDKFNDFEVSIDFKHNNPDDYLDNLDNEEKQTLVYKARAILDESPVLLWFNKTLYFDKEKNTFIKLLRAIHYKMDEETEDEDDAYDKGKRIIFSDHYTLRSCNFIMNILEKYFSEKELKNCYIPKEF